MAKVSLHVIVLIHVSHQSHDFATLCHGLIKLGVDGLHLSAQFSLLLLSFSECVVLLKL